jgi:mono/diheme cytochrome c family protein
MSVCRSLFSFLVVLVVATFASPQDQKPEIKHVPAPSTSAASGKQMFNAYCASCHGVDAKGDGPAASALKSPPADLTQLAKSNGGKYPALRVSSALTGTAELAAHGNKDMPVWGPIFYRMGGGSEAEEHQRIANLNHYIESLQAK